MSRPAGFGHIVWSIWGPLSSSGKPNACRRTGRSIGRLASLSGCLLGVLGFRDPGRSLGTKESAAAPCGCALDRGAV